MAHTYQASVAQRNNGQPHPVVLITNRFLYQRVGQVDVRRLLLLAVNVSSEKMFKVKVNWNASLSPTLCFGSSTCISREYPTLKSSNRGMIPQKVDKLVLWIAATLIKNEPNSPKDHTIKWHIEIWTNLVNKFWSYTTDKCKLMVHVLWINANSLGNKEKVTKICTVKILPWLIMSYQKYENIWYKMEASVS